MSGPALPSIEGRSLQLVTLVIADGRPLLLRGLEAICSREPGFEVVAACARADAALDALRTRRPDVLILDAALPPSGGLWVLRRMRREKLATRTVLLADRLAGRHVLEATRLGVAGILLPHMTPESLLRCVRAVHAGERCLDGQAGAGRLDPPPRSDILPPQLASGLTPRQVEIVRLATEAMSTREIAARLMVSEGTVKVHLHNIYAKLQVDGRVGLVLLTMKHGQPWGS